MITCYEDYLEYVTEDLKASCNGSTNVPLSTRLLPNHISFQLALRKAEYYNNCVHAKLLRPIVKLVKLRYRIIGRRCGYTIPINVCGKGLNIAHEGTIVINGDARIGDYCRIHTCVNIGYNAGTSTGAPIIGNGVYIGPGAKLFGNIVIADNIAIGANAVVNKSFLEPNTTIAGIPARIVSRKGSKGLLYNPLDKN